MVRMLKAWWKKLFKTDAVHTVIGWLCAIYTRFVLLTGKMHSHLHEESKPYFNGENPAIFALWHSRIMLIQSHAPSKRTMQALVSNHSDGRLIGRVLQYYGIQIIHGSTSRGGTQALRDLIAAYKQGNNLAITPDGPRGPARITSEGVAQLALLTKAPIICVGFSAARHKTLSSWDRLMIALPFSKLYFVSSRPIIVDELPVSDDKYTRREALRLRIEQELNRITDEADRLAGIL